MIAASSGVIGGIVVLSLVTGGWAAAHTSRATRTRQRWGLWPGSYEVTTPRPVSAQAPPARGRQIPLRTRSQSVAGSDPSAGGALLHHLCQSTCRKPAYRAMSI